MLARLRPRSAYDVMAALALFIAISTGGAYAANTVFSTDIVDGEVKTPDIQNGAVTTNKLATRAVTSAKVADNNLTANDLAIDAVGASEIAADAVGAGELNTVLTFGHLVHIGPGMVGEAVATCFPGWIRLSGGAAFDFPSGEISASRPSGNAEAWVAEGSNNGGQSQALTAWVTCLKP